MPENELCAACKKLRELENTKENIEERKNIIKVVSKSLNDWTNANLDKETTVYAKGEETHINRTYVKVGDEEIKVGKKFFGETLSKAKRSNDLAVVIETIKDFKEWMPDAKFERIEELKHHDFDFYVYTVEYEGKKIEFKCKNTEGLIAYTMLILE